MRFTTVLALSLTAAAALAACDGPEKSATQDGAPTATLVQPESLTGQELAEGKFTPEILWKMGRIGGMVLSPDRKQLLYTVTHYSVAENRGSTRLYRHTLGEAEPILVEEGAMAPQWVGPNGDFAYLKVVDGAAQVFLTAQNQTPKQVTSFSDGVESFWFSPDAARLLYAQFVQVEKTTLDRYPNLGKANVRIIDSLMYRHWDYWVDGRYSHLFLADLVDGKAQPGQDLLEDQPWDCPMSPGFSAEEVAWSPKGDAIFYTCKKSQGRVYATTTNSDVYRYDLATKTHTNLTALNPGYDRNPVLSPDGTQLLWQRMLTPGYESDRAMLMHCNLATGEVRELLPDFDRNADAYQWSDDASEVYILSGINGTHQLFRLTMADGAVTQLTQGQWDINWAGLAADGSWVVQRSQLNRAPELYTLRDTTFEPLTHINQPIYDAVAFSEVEGRLMKTTDGGTMLTWIVYPPHFDPAKKYPTILYCQGGPQSTVSQFWSYRWNLQLMAAQGYVVVAPNRHGVPSFGQAWNRQISGDYSGQNIRDYLTAIDNIAKEPWCDKEHLGAVGASYGGYSVYYLAGVHEGRFKAFIAHNGMFNLESFYASTEETFFPNHDLGGPYWDKGNAVAQRSYANSPHKLVQKWDTPIMVIVGERDFRIAYTEGLQAFNAAQLRGIPSRLLVFPEETHFVTKPQNAIVWQHEFFGWLDHWLK